MPAVTQKWTHRIPMMQQTVLLTAVRGPDGIAKYEGVKFLLRWFRRCVLLSALDGKILDSPMFECGGSFIGPSLDFDKLNEEANDLNDYVTYSEWQEPMDKIVDEYLRSVDALPNHFQMHFMHATEILGYKHPDKDIRDWWHSVYLRLVNSLHLRPEPKEDMDKRLGDCEDGWLSYSDRATIS